MQMKVRTKSLCLSLFQCIDLNVHSYNRGVRAHKLVMEAMVARQTRPPRQYKWRWGKTFQPDNPCVERKLQIVKTCRRFCQICVKTWAQYRFVCREFVIPQFISTAGLEMCARGPQAIPSVKPLKYWRCYVFIFCGPYFLDCLFRFNVWTVLMVVLWSSFCAGPDLDGGIPGA